MSTKQNHIMDAAAFLFSVQGIKATTMSEIAQHCGISKKTLYQFFADKEMLVIAVVQNIVSKNQQIVRVSPAISPNAAFELCNFFGYIESRLAILTPPLLRDLKRYYYDANKLLEQSRNSRLVPYIKQNIIRGIAEDIYRSDLDGNTMGWLYCWQLQYAMEDISFHNEKRQGLVSSINSTFLHGIVNAKGLKLLLKK